MNENVLEQIKTDPAAYPAVDFLHGNTDFDVLLVPFHMRQCDAWQGGEHWMMAIYDKRATSGRQFIMFDPKPKTNARGRPILENDHHTILRHILETVTPASKLTGTAMLPRFDCNRQWDDDFSSCGFFACYYAKEYLDRGCIRFDPEFDIRKVRRELYETMMEIRVVQRNAERAQNCKRGASIRSLETEQQREQRQEKERNSIALRRGTETEQQRAQRQETDRKRMAM